MQDIVRQACDHPTDYPMTLQQEPGLSYRLQVRKALLDARRGSLFSDDGELRMWERESYQKTCGRQKKLSNEDEVHHHFGLKGTLFKEDPQTRFIFVIAYDSRSPLLVTYEMLTCVLTYHQVMAPFADLLLSFGKQEYHQDFHYTSFFAQSPILGSGNRQAFPAVGRSSNVLQLCYNLKAPEKYDYQVDWPWALRPAAIYHSLDLENGRTTWIAVKANEVLSQRILASSNIMNGAPEEKKGTTPFGVALSASLTTHLIICDWAAENWRWYINFLEHQLQQNSRETLSVMADEDSKVLDQWVEDAKSGTTLYDRTEPKLITLKKRISSFTSKPQPSVTAHVSSYTRSGLSPGSDHTNGASGVVTPFLKLQKIQDIGERANEATLVLKANAEVICGLRSHYRALIEADDSLPMGRESKNHVLQFERQLVELERILKMEQSRTEALLRLIDDRKNLVYGLLNHQNMRASRLSTQKMEDVTLEMHEIARRTQQETVSMRIITFITLIFLPGTFVSTIMSTDIITWDMDSSNKPRKTVFVGALRFFVTLTTPLVVFTLTVWAAVYWYENRKERKRLGRASSA